MWLEIKAGFIAFSTIVFCIVASILFVTDGGFLLAILCILGIGLMVIGNILEGFRITNTNADKWIDRPPGGFVPILLVTLAKGVDIVWAKKKPHGKREFIYNDEDASVIDLGDYPVHFPSGATGCIAHEKSRQNINLAKARYAEDVYAIFGTDDIKEIYYKAKELDQQRADLEEDGLNGCK